MVGLHPAERCSWEAGVVRVRSKKQLLARACWPSPVPFSEWASSQAQEMTLLASCPQLSNCSHAGKIVLDALGHPPEGHMRLNHSSGSNLQTQPCKVGFVGA